MRKGILRGVPQADGSGMIERLVIAGVYAACAFGLYEIGQAMMGIWKFCYCGSGIGG